MLIIMPEIKKRNEKLQIFVHNLLKFKTKDEVFLYRIVPKVLVIIPV